MTPAVLIEVERGTVGGVTSPSAAMTGLVPVTLAAPLVQSGEKRPRFLGSVGGGGRDTPGHDDVNPTAEPRR